MRLPALPACGWACTVAGMNALSPGASRHAGPPRWLPAFALTALLLAALPQARAQALSPSRGELLYTTHCIACHTTEMHWRDKRAARDWDSLKALVRRWQATASLDWSEADVAEVARYLNDSIYRFERGEKVAVAVAPAVVAARR